LPPSQRKDVKVQDILRAASFATTISVVYISNYFIVKKIVDTLRIRSIKVIEEVVVVIDVIAAIIASGTNFT
jgi:hypothetical protein